MQRCLYRKFISYLCNNFIGNFLGFVIGMGSTRVVSQFFTTRSIKNVWGLTAHKTVVDKQTFHAFKWLISIIVGFLVFELISKWIQQKIKPISCFTHTKSAAYISVSISAVVSVETCKIG